MTHQIGEAVTDTFMQPGTLLGVNGQDFIITEYLSGTNYLGKRLSDGKEYRLKRSGRYIYKGFDLDLLKKHKNEDFEMGAIVRLTGSGKMKDAVGVVAKHSGSRLLVALPGSQTMQIPASMLQRATAADLATYCGALAVL